jgi:hypothetical protein
MAKRSRKHRQRIPGYDESRPTREERKKQHRATRHAANQMLHTFDDPDGVVLPQGRRTRTHETSNGHQSPARRRFRVWKTKFWKRRDDFREEKAAIDAVWPVVTPNQLQEE